MRCNLLRVLAVASLLLVNQSVLAQSKYRNKCSALLMQQAFLAQFKYAVELHEVLEPVKEPYLRAIGWPFKNQRSLDKIAEQFSYRVGRGPKIRAKIELYTTPEK